LTGADVYSVGKPIAVSTLPKGAGKIFIKFCTGEETSPEA